MKNIFTLLRTFQFLSQLRSHDSWNRHQLKAHQQLSLARLRSYIYTNSPFYQWFHKGLYDKPLEELPILTKSLLMTNYDQLVTDRAIRLEDARQLLTEGSTLPYLGHYHISATSGSSGNPGLMLYDELEWIAVMASFARGQGLGGVKMGPLYSHKFAFILSPLLHHLENRVSETMRSPWARLLYISASDSVECIVKKLNHWQPEVLGAYVSEARLLALEQLSGRLKIHPRWIFTSAELLPTETRHLIYDAWGIEPFNEYAATETAVIAAECEQHDGLHLYEDLLIVENVDNQNHAVPPGVVGDKLLVTVLYNRTQPLIRYQLEDFVQVTGEPCRCGRPYARIMNIEGREEETLYVESSEGKRIQIYPTVFEEVMDLVRVHSWQIVQRTDGLHVLVTGNENEVSVDQLKHLLQQTLQAKGIPPSPLYVQLVDSIPHSMSGKQPLIKSELPMH